MVSDGAPLMIFENSAAAEVFRARVAWRRAAGYYTDFWWRDDDFVRDTPRIRALANLATELAIMPLIGVIPSRVDRGLAGFLRAYPRLSFCQHGYAHRNYEPPNQAENEFGASRVVNAVRADVVAGREQMDRIFGDTHLRVFVPPWNRFAPQFAEISDRTAIYRLLRPRGRRRTCRRAMFPFMSML